MANYRLNKTGQEIDAALDKIEATPTITSIGDGLSLTSGVLSASGGGGGGTQLYEHILETYLGITLYIITSRESQYTSGSTILEDAHTNILRGHKYDASGSGPMRTVNIKDIVSYNQGTDGYYYVKLSDDTEIDISSLSIDTVTPL